MGDVAREVPEQKCHDVPMQVPREECHQVPRKECTSVPREVCAPEPIRECVQVSSSWTSAKFNNIQEQCQVLTILRCRENSAERCQVGLALKFLCCSVFRCASLAYHASLFTLENSPSLSLF